MTDKAATPVLRACPTCDGAGRVRGKLRNGTWGIEVCWRCDGSGQDNTDGPLLEAEE